VAPLEAFDANESAHGSPRSGRLCGSVSVYRRRRLLGVGDLHRAASAESTSELNIIPLSWCSAMWQWAIQRPGWEHRGG
jgi:hypothetical protein